MAPARRASQHRDEPEHARGRRERDRPEPETLGDPVGHAHLLHQPVVRPHREEVSDVLMRDGPGADVAVPEVRRTREQPTGVQIEVLLRVSADLARRRQQERHVREQREAEQLDAMTTQEPAERRCDLRRAPLEWDARSAVGAPISGGAVLGQPDELEDDWSGDTRVGTRPLSVERLHRPHCMPCPSWRAARSRTTRSRFPRVPRPGVRTRLGQPR